MQRLDITGERYGRLIAVSRIPGTAPSRWRFKCDCGGKTTALLSNIRTGQIISCGCAGSRQTIGRRSLKHGHSVGFQKSRTAAAWHNAKTRCFYEKGEGYANYGGRGITMCEEWADDFGAFLRDMGECPDGLTLERDDVNGNYEPGNCRWATMQDQQNNRRDSIVRTEGMPLKDFAASLGLKYKSLCRRISLYGESPEEAAAWYATKRHRPGQSTSRTKTE